MESTYLFSEDNKTKDILSWYTVVEYIIHITTRNSIPSPILSSNCTCIGIWTDPLHINRKI